MFGREANVKHSLLASESPRYLGTDKSMINLELMKKLYLVVTHNLHEARIARDKNTLRKISREVDILRVGDNILFQDHTSKVFQLSSLNCIDLFDSSRSRCGCSARASFSYNFRFDESRSQWDSKYIQKQSTGMWL